MYTALVARREISVMGICLVLFGCAAHKDAPPPLQTADEVEPPIAEGEAAADAFLMYCDRTWRGQALPASRNIGNSRAWHPHGFRSCSWQGRHVIRVTCAGGNLIRPKLHIVNDNTGARKEYFVPKDGKPRYCWNDCYPGPRDPQTHWYHVHLHQTNVVNWLDATFHWCIIRVGR